MKLRKLITLATIMTLFTSSTKARASPKALNRFKDIISSGALMSPTQKSKEREELNTKRLKLRKQLTQFLDNISRNPDWATNEDLQKTWEREGSKKKKGTDILVAKMVAENLGGEHLKLFKKFEKQKNYMGLAALIMYYSTSTPLRFQNAASSKRKAGIRR